MATSPAATPALTAAAGLGAHCTPPHPSSPRLPTPPITPVALCVLRSQLPDARDVENRLVMLLDFDRFELIKELLRNATRIVWCMRLARAQVGTT